MAMLGVFGDLEAAEGVVEALRGLGIPDERITVALRPPAAGARRRVVVGVVLQGGPLEAVAALLGVGGAGPAGDEA